MRRALVLVLGPLLLVGPAHAGTGAMPPWTDPDDLPIPAWAKSVAPKKDDEPVFAQPNRGLDHRGSVALGARLPLYGAKRGPGCEGRWLLVGPMAWICSDAAEVSPDDPILDPPVRLIANDEGLPYRYYFVGKDGASGFSDLARIDDDAPDQDLEPGFGVAVAHERTVAGERYVRTHHGTWIALRELGEAHPAPFRGEAVAEGAALDFAWVLPERASTFASSTPNKVQGSRMRYQVVRWREERPAPGGAMVRISDDGTRPEEWMRTRDLAHPTSAAPPDDIGGPSTGERWVDVEIASQTLVAYEGTHPVYATMVSTGKGPAGTDTATPLGVHRVWVKLLSTDMGNLRNEDADEHYSIEDVPYVQFFDKAVALHGAFWHHDFGHVHSHGCVNMAPVDARWLFVFTAPHLLGGWSAAMPVPFEKGTAVRVR